MHRLGSGFECLEDRTLLAATVTAALSSGTLTITGASSDNVITVSGDGTTSDVHVSVGNGEVLDVTGGTLVDSQDGTFKGVVNIVLQGGAGNDTLELQDLRLAGNVSVNGQGGTDDITFGSVTLNSYVGGSVSLNGVDGTNDTIDVFVDPNLKMAIQGDLTTSESGGTMKVDVLAYGNISISGNVTMNESSVAGGTGLAGLICEQQGSIDVGGNVAITGGDGNDTLGIRAYGTHYYGAADQGFVALNIAGKLTIEGNGGDDNIGIVAYGTTGANGTAVYNVSIFGNTVLNGGDGNDFIGLAGINSHVSIGDSLTLNGDNGNDTLGMVAHGTHGWVAVGKNVYLNGDAGDDLIGAYGILVAGHVKANGGTGNDQIDMTHATVDRQLVVAGGSGNDTIGVDQSNVGKNVSVNGGVGIDAAYVGPNNIGGNLNESGFDTTLGASPFGAGPFGSIKSKLLTLFG